MASQAEQAVDFPDPYGSTPSQQGHRLRSLSVAAGSAVQQPPPPKFSTFLMNDIPRGTSRAKLAKFLLAQSHGPPAPHHAHSPQVVFGSAIHDSRLDDELSVATLEFSDTPAWLLNQDPSGFPKHTLLGTIWLGVDRAALDRHGRTEFIRAVINSHGRLGPLYAEMLAEFADTDVNIQDQQGRTALHWACAEVLPDMVGLCLSIPEVDSGLRDNDGFTAFDLALRTGQDFLPNLFYSSMLETNETSPQVALLRVLTLSSDESSVENRPLFPGEALFQPVGDQNSPLVVALLDRGVELTTKDEDGNTALHIAAGQVDNVEMVTRLLDAGSDINAIGNGGSTPLHIAVRGADVEMVELFLHRKADIAITDKDEMLALHWAAQNGQVDIARALLQVGADAGARDRLGRTSVDVAKENREVLVVELLNTEQQPEEPAVPDPSNVLQDDLQAQQLKHPVRNSSDSTNLLQAAWDGDIDTVRTLLAQGADPDTKNKYSETALHLAVERGHSHIVKILLVAGAKIEALNHERNRPLHVAALYGHMEIVKELLAAGAKIEPLDRDGDSPLHCATWSGHTEIVKELLAAGAEVEPFDRGGDRPLHCAAMRGHTEIMKELLAAGAEIEALDRDGDRPLHCAARFGHTEIMKELLAAGAEIEALDQHGNSPLHCAVLAGHTEIVKELLAAGAEIEAKRRDQNKLFHGAALAGGRETVKDPPPAGGETTDTHNVAGETAFQLARRWGRTEIVKIFIDFGNQNSSRLLHSAIRSRDTLSVKELVAAGADMEAVDRDGNRALHSAVLYGLPNSVEELLAAGADIEAEDRDGNRALHSAALLGHKEIVKELLAAGSQSEARNREGKTAFQLASREGKPEIVKILRAQTSTADRVRSNVRYRLGMTE